MVDLPQNIIDSVLRFFATKQGAKTLSTLRDVHDGVIGDSAITEHKWQGGTYETIGQWIINDLGMAYSPIDEELTRMYEKRGLQTEPDATDLGKRVVDQILGSGQDPQAYLDSLTAEPKVDPTQPMIESLAAEQPKPRPIKSGPSAAARVAKKLNQFADIRTGTTLRNKKFTGANQRIQYRTRRGAETVVTSQIDRAVGTMGVFGMFHDKKEAVGTKHIQEMIADLAAALKVDATDEFDGERFLATRQKVAEVFRDMLHAIKHINQNRDMLTPEQRDTLAAVTLEMSRILHDYSSPRTRAIFQNMYKKLNAWDPKSGASFGLTANAAEIEAQGVKMPKDALPGEKARLQRVAAAQVGQVPQQSIGEQPSATRELAAELRGAGEDVHDLQRYVDEHGLFGSDTAAIDMKGMIKYTGPAPSTRRGPNGERPIDIGRVEKNYSVALREFLSSPLGFLADDVLDMKQFFYETKTGDLKLRPLTARGDFDTAIALRTNKKYRSRTSGNKAAAAAEMQLLIGAGERATRASKGSFVRLVIPEEGMTFKIPETGIAIMKKRLADWEAARAKLAETMGDKDAAAYMKTEEGIARFGEKPTVLTEVKLSGQADTRTYTETGSPAPRVILMPESVAAELVAANPDIAPSVKRIGDTFELRFAPVVSPQYLVLKNGTVVSARSAEEGSVITHRKVYPVKINRAQDGTISVERLDARQYEVTDPGVRYNVKDAKATIKRFIDTFSADIPLVRPDGTVVEKSPSLKHLGFGARESGPLFEEVMEIIRTDAYSALEILAMNGDHNPPLESELISAITEVGDFRVERAPEYFKARQGAIEGVQSPGKLVSTSGGVSRVTTLALGSLKGRTLTAAEARMLPLAGMDNLRLEHGTVQDIVFNPEVFGLAPSDTIASDVESGQAIIRGLQLLKRMGMIAGVQIGYGGLRAPDLRYVTKSGAVETIRREPFWMMADKDTYERAGRATTAADAAERAFGVQVPELSTEAGRAALAAISEGDEATLLAARAAVEVARGILGPEWSIELDPQYLRTRFPENPDTSRKAADSELYPYARLLDSVGAPETVIETTLSQGGDLAAMRAAGALSSKADKFFMSLLLKGIEIPKPPKGPEVGPSMLPGTVKFDPEKGWILEQPNTPAKKLAFKELTADQQNSLIVETVNQIRIWMNQQSGPINRIDPKTGTSTTLEPSSAMLGGPAELTPAERAQIDSLKVTTIEEANRIVPVEDVRLLFDPVVETRIIDNIKTETRASGETRTVEMGIPLDPATKDLISRITAKVTTSDAVPKDHIRIVSKDGTTETIPVIDFLRRKKAAKNTIDDADGMEIASDYEHEYSWSSYDDTPDITTDSPEAADVVPSTRSPLGKVARKVALRAALDLQAKGSTSAQDVVERVLKEFKVEIGDISDVKTLNKFFEKFWVELTDVTLGKNVYTKTRQLVRSMGKNIWVEKGIALLNQGPEGTPALGITTRPVSQDKNGQSVYGPEETIVVTKKGGRLINADVAMPILKEMRPIFMDADLKVARPFYQWFADFFGVTPKVIDGEVQLPRLAQGPATKIIDVSIRQINQGRIPEFNTDLVPDSTVHAVSMDEQGAVQAPTRSATGRPKSTTNAPEAPSYDDLGGGFYENSSHGDYTTSDGLTDPEINYSVKQGKLLGLLAPDRLVPKMGPTLRGFDAHIRTPMGGTVAGAALDFANLGLSGNLTPENALFTGALNATQLLSKSPLKATAIGAAASLGATAVTGGDIGRTLFNLVGSMGGGLIGGVASGGLGSFGGSVAGGFVADELWKALFNQNAGWQVHKSTAPAPELKVRVP